MLCISAYASAVYFLDKLLLELQVQIIDVSTGATARDGEIVGPVNNLVNSMIDDVKISLFSTTVNGRNTTQYGMRSMMYSKSHFFA